MKSLTKAVALTFLLTTLVAPFAYAQTSTQARVMHAFNLPAQALATSLKELGNQAHINVMFDPAAVAGAEAPALQGRYEVKQALRKLLAGTHLKARFTNATTVVVVKNLAELQSKAQSRAINQQKNPEKMSAVNVIGSVSALTATRAETPLKDIPQSVSVISRQTLDQQNATTLPEALRYQPGMQLFSNNSEQVYAYSRGFIVGSVHVDGGSPIQTIGGSVDVMSRNLAEYGSVEVLQGSDALFGGMGNPGATISLKRKMPTSDFQGKVTASVGSWRNYRGVVDLSGPLTKDKKLTGRVVVSGTDKHNFYHIAKKRGYMLYGVLKYDFGPSTSVDFGGSYQRSLAVNAFQGLPWYANGENPHLSRKLALTTPWARNDTRFYEGFAKFDSALSTNWHLNIQGTYQKEKMPQFITASVLGAIDPTTNLMTEEGVPSAIGAIEGPLGNVQQMISTAITGKFDWLGHIQHVMFGASYEHDDIAAGINEPNPAVPPLPPVDPFSYNPALYPEPDFSPGNLFLQFNYTETTIQWGLYGAVRLQPVDHLSIVAGGRLSTYRDFQVDHTNVFGIVEPASTDHFSEKNHFTPYYGLIYSINKHYSLYASFADIYHTNAGMLTKDLKQIPPADGDTLEFGAKGSWFDNTLNGRVALFKVMQKGVGTFNPATPNSSPAGCCYLTETVHSKGIDTELTGMLTPRWQMTVGYTYTEHVSSNSFIRSQLPKNTFKLWTNYMLPGGKWSFGGGLRMRSVNSVMECSVRADVCPDDKWVEFHQGFYSVVGLRAAYNISADWSAALNIDNLLDRTYFQTLQELEAGNWYGAPRNFMFKFIGRF